MMDAYTKEIYIKVFAKDQYQLPIVFSTDDLKKESADLLSSYIKDLKSLDIDKTVIDRVWKFKKSVTRMMSNYLTGVQNRAFYNFEKAINNLQILDSKLVLGEIQDELMYRGRINKDIRDFSDNEMFHIPLNKRGVVSTQRFSFPGLPCIYVGASSYPCWVELNKPSFESLQMATIKPSDLARKMKVLDISHAPQHLESIINEDWFDINEYILYWPLIAMCSIRVNHDENYFKPEYIFPQFLLQYILSKHNLRNKFIGIKYASIKVAAISGRQLSEDWHTFTCYAFPSQTANMKDEQCEHLTDMFHVQKTRSGKELQLLSKVISIDKATTKFEDNKDSEVRRSRTEYVVNWRIYTHDGKAYPYELSEFGMIEKALKRDDFDFSSDEIIMSPYTNEELDALFL